MNLREEYKKCLIQTYNDYIDHINVLIPELNTDEKLDIHEKFVAQYLKLKESFSILKLNYEFSTNLLLTIDINKVTAEIETSTPDNNSDSNIKTNQDISNTKDSSTEQNQSTATANLALASASHSQIPSLHNSDSDDNSSTDTVIDSTMAQTPKDFITMAHHMINYRYDGDPLALNSFLDAISLLEELVEEANQNIFLKFIMTRLEGKARELIADDAKTVKDIVDALKAGIKTESSKVIEGRILALRADKSSLVKFAEQAEKLAEQFNRSLCVEGFSKEKAKEITIQKTVEMCRKSSRNDTVKAVLAASTFTEPKEVIAKMIVEINNLKQDKPNTLYTHKYGNNNKNNGHHNNNNGNKNGYRSRGGSHNNGNRSFNGNSHGNGRSNYRNGQNNYSNNNSRTYSNNRQANEQSIRHISGNESAPGNSGLSPNP